MHLYLGTNATPGFVQVEATLLPDFLAGPPVFRVTFDGGHPDGIIGGFASTKGFCSCIASAIQDHLAYVHRDRTTPRARRLSPAAAEIMRREINDAGGREVSFVCTVGADGVLESARVDARGRPRCCAAVATKRSAR